ncbi:MAG TPA: alpha/beta hydrolase [Candidatus Thioglobus sp.]|jgi:alpha-beta hydrolase superfamily lysophospholipase|nr:alpha/beta hydrolase [Candidatus Thioglobus sp.]HIL42431.1 alpha/beta hydrolase [Gammaproteobacteria bacterium]
MIKKDGFFHDINGSNIFYQCWLPKDDIKAVLLVVHGLAEHSGRYMNIVNEFVPMGFAVYALDHIGHGKSDGIRGYVNRFSDYTNTLKIYLDKVLLWQTGKPIFLIGHSMGGLISAEFLVNYDTELAGVIFSAPSIQAPKKTSIWLVMAGKLLSKFLPKVKLIKLTSSSVSSDQKVVSQYFDDELVYNGKTTARLAYEIFISMEMVVNNLYKINLPIIIFQGSQDKLVHPDGAQLLFESVRSSDKTLKIYSEMYHEVFNEPDHEKVLNDLRYWLESRT